MFDLISKIIIQRTFDKRRINILLQVFSYKCCVFSLENVSDYFLHINISVINKHNNLKNITYSSIDGAATGVEGATTHPGWSKLFNIS